VVPSQASNGEQPWKNISDSTYLLHHSLGDQRINRRLGKGGCNTQAGAIARSVIDNRTAVRTNVGQKLRTEVVEAPGTEIVFPPQGLQLADDPFEITYRAIDASVPQTPFHRPDIPIDAGKRLNKFRLRSNQVISDLLHGLDFHSDVEPVDDMFCRRRHGTG